MSSKVQNILSELKECKELISSFQTFNDETTYRNVLTDIFDQSNERDLAKKALQEQKKELKAHQWFTTETMGNQSMVQILPDNIEFKIADDNWKPIPLKP